MTNIIKIGEMKKIKGYGIKMVWLTRRPDLGCYSIMLLKWDEVYEKACGWYTMTTGTLKECRDYYRRHFLSDVIE